MQSEDPTLVQSARDDSRDESQEAFVPPRHLSRAGRGTVIGRYVVLDEVGRGAMGAVLSAYDPRLDRQVALKLLHDELASDERSERLLREAQSLGRLNHPNVVTVHDVGEHDGHLFVAMELVRGKTLRTWLDDGVRGWREVLAAFLQAARGLQAAHEAGVIHRDFKPDNVMVADDGRVLVMDFGLARSGAIATAPKPAPSLATSSDLTRTGTLLGTPSYMSPEQFRGDDLGPASDQFSFCVALYEALVGVRPFRADSLAELASTVAAGRRQPDPREARVPRWLLSVIDRGLSTDPGDRFASMADLSAGLERGMARPRAMVIGLVVTGAVALAAGAGLAGDDDGDCRDAIGAFDAAWSDVQRQELAAGFAASGHRRAEEIWGRSEAAIDEFAAAWKDEYRRVCGSWRDTLPAPLLEARRRCLAVQRDHLETLLETLTEPDAKTVALAGEASAGLPEPPECNALTSADDVPPEASIEAVLTAQRAMARAQAFRLVRRRDAEGEALAQAAAALDGLDTPRVAAQVGYRRSENSAALGRVDEAEMLLREAQRAAARSSDRRLVAELWLERIAQIDIHRIDQLDRAEHLLEVAELAVATAGDDPRQVARLSAVRGMVANDQGRYDEAGRLLRQAIEAGIAAGSSAGRIAAYRNLLAGVYIKQADYRRAIDEGRTAVQTVTDAYGSAHPQVLLYRSTIGGACLMLGDRGCARSEFEAAQTQIEDAGEVASLDLAFNLGYLAELEYWDDHPQAAEDRARRALAVWDALGQSRRIDTLGPRTVLYRVARDGDDHTEALERAGEIRRLQEEALGPDHPEATSGLQYEGETLMALGRLGEALQALDRVLEQRERALGPNHEKLVSTLVQRGELFEALDRERDALLAYARAHEIASKIDGQPGLRGDAGWRLARLRWAMGQRGPETIELGHAARESLVQAGPVGDEVRHDVERWLHERGASLR